MIYTDPATMTPSGWLARQNRAAEKIARAKDPERHLIQAIRTGMLAIDSAAEDATRDYAAANAPVASPLPLMVHPHVAARVRAFLDEHGIVDVLAPLEGESLEKMVARYQASAKAANDEAIAALRTHEVAKAQAVVDAANAKLLAVRAAGAEDGVVLLDEDDDHVEVLPVRRGPGRPRLSDES